MKMSLDFLKVQLLFPRAMIHEVADNRELLETAGLGYLFLDWTWDMRISEEIAVWFLKFKKQKKNVTGELKTKPERSGTT